MNCRSFLAALGVVLSAAVSSLSATGLFWSLGLGIGLNLLMKLMRGGPIATLAATALIVFVPPLPVALLAFINPNVGFVAYAMAEMGWILWLALKTTKSA